MKPEAFDFKKKLNICLKAMEAGVEIQLKSGHILAIADGHEEPGFKVTHYERWRSRGTPMVFQIGSDTAWMSLIAHCKKMTQQECVDLMFSYAEIPSRVSKR